MNFQSYLKKKQKNPKKPTDGILTPTSIQPQLLTCCLKGTSSPWWNYGSFLWRRKAPAQLEDSEASSVTKEH